MTLFTDHCVARSVLSSAAYYPQLTCDQYSNMLITIKIIDHSILIARIITIKIFSHSAALVCLYLVTWLIMYVFEDSGFV